MIKKKDIIIEVELDGEYKRHIEDKRTIILQSRGDNNYHLFSIHHSKFTGIDSLKKNKNEGSLVLFHHGVEVSTSETI